jgi:hypothetical protein
MRPVNTTERNMPLFPRAPNPYYLTPEARAALKRRSAEIRAHLALRRALRQARDAVAQTKRPLP